MNSSSAAFFYLLPFSGKNTHIQGVVKYTWSSLIVGSSDFMSITLARLSFPSITDDLSGKRDNSIRMLDVLEAENSALREKVADLALATAFLRDELDVSRRRLSRDLTGASRLP
jgi:hypothetical protein